MPEYSIGEFVEFIGLFFYGFVLIFILCIQYDGFLAPCPKLE